MDDRRHEGPTKPEDPTVRALAKLAPAGLFGYAAGKSIIAKRLVRTFPAHKAYTEVFAGSAAMFFTKDAAPHEVLNDRNDEIMHVYRTVQTLSKRDFARLVAKDWRGTNETFRSIRKSAPTDPIDRFYKTLYVLNFSYAKGMQRFDHTRKGVVAVVTKRITKLQPRLAGTVLLAGDYEKALLAHDHKDAFHFLDPPYAGYGSSVGVGEKEFDEARFRKVLERLQGRFLCTYGVKGKLDTSGFELKRMRQPRFTKFMCGVSKDKYLTHLLISNFQITAKSLGPGIDLADVVSVIDTDGDQERIMVTGSRTSVAVPDTIETVKAMDRVTGLFEVRIDRDGAHAVNFSIQKSGTWVHRWTLAAARMPAVEAPNEVAKSFAPEGNRYFLPLTEGVPARSGVQDHGGDRVVKTHRPEVELGVQTESLHEYFVKDEDFAGVLRVEKDPTLGEEYPWLATFSDGFPLQKRGFAVLEPGVPLPPEGTSALPSALARLVPDPFCYWTQKGVDAEHARAALAASGYLDPNCLAIVDGEFCRVATKLALDDAPLTVSSDPDWAIAKAAMWVPDVGIVEVFSSDRTAIHKAGSDRVAYIDCGDCDPEALGTLVTTLAKREGPYMLSAIDTPETRMAFERVGRPFRMRPGPTVGIDAARRVFVTSFPIAPSEQVQWIGKAEWTAATVNDLPDGAFLYIEPGGTKDEEGKTKPRSLRHFPYKDKSGAVDAAHARNAIARIPQSNAPGLSADKKQALQERARRELEAAQKAKPVLTDVPSDDSPDLGKADLATPPGGTGPGFLQPAQGYGKKPRYESRKFQCVLTKAEDTKDERIVYGIVLEPDTVDAQDDIYSAEEVRAAAHAYMQDFQNTGFMHQTKINGKAKVVESYLAPSAFSLGGQQVKKGTWVMAMRVIDDALWKQCKEGALTGFSIGGSAKRTPEPTAKGMRRTEFQGIPITIDRPKGYVQSGRNEKGEPWERTYKVDYGYIPRTKGGDGEGLDVFLGPDPDADTVYWIAQKKSDGSFDEYKAMLGFNSPEAARKTYVDHVPERFFGTMFPMGIEAMKALLNQEPAHDMTA